MTKFKSQEERVFEHNEFSGLRNNVPANRFGLDDLVDARNVDIDDSKRVTRRYGFGAAVNSTATKSLWSKGGVALAVQNETNLVQIMPDFSINVLRSDITPGLDMSFAAVPGRIFYSNGVDTGVVENGASRTWGIVPPQGQPDASEIGGVLRAGTYQYAVTYLRNDLQESGTALAGKFDVTTQGGIRLTNISVSDDPGVTKKVVYFSKWNEDTLYRVGVIANDVTAFDYQLEASMQVPISTHHLKQAPAGSIVAEFSGGRMLVASGRTLYYSEPLAFELFDMRKNYQFSNAITLVAPVQNGVYVGTLDEIVWLSGEIPEKFKKIDKFAYGAIRGAVAYCSRDMVLEGEGNGTLAVFASSQGICIGDDNGNLLNVTQNRFSYPVQDRGAALIRRHRGLVQGVFAMQGTEQFVNAAR